MKQRGRAVVLAILCVLIFVSAAGIARGGRAMTTVPQGDVDEPVIYPAGGFYEKDVSVQITAPKDAVVCYTLNGVEPDTETGQVYTAPLTFAAGAEETVYTLRVKVFYHDGSASKVYTDTYFCGSEIRSRYDNPVLSIVGDPEGLFGYDDGILVPGKRYDEFLEAHPGAHPGGGVEANYTMRGADAERAVALAFYDTDGQCLCALDGGVRVAGELSRLNDQKSLRLYARSEYDEENKFRYDFFGDLYSLQDGTLGQSYKRLLLQNAGQDYGYGFIRTQLVGKLADQAGFPDTQHVRPVCVYINGDYYGSYWLANTFDKAYFEDRYGAYEGTFELVEGGDRLKTAAGEEAQDAALAGAYNKAYDRFAAMDLTDDANYAALCAFMDVENYLRYFAIENYVGNDDWPDSNVKAYRYNAGAGAYGEGAFDGRYRMLLFDADYGFGLLFYYDTIGCLVNEMTLQKILYEKSPLFAALMEREDCRQMFTSYTMDLINGAMRAENVAEQVDLLHASRRDELARTLDTEGLVGGLLLDPAQLSMETVEWNIERIKAFAQERPPYVLQDIAEQFGYEEMYRLEVTAESSYAAVQVNTVCSADYAAKYAADYAADQAGEYAAESTEGAAPAVLFSGTYLKEIPVTLTALPGPNETFVGWVVDGETYDTEVLTLHGADIAADHVEVQLLVEECAEPRLLIGAVAAKGNADYVEVINASSVPVSTGGYYLSDGDDPYRYALPKLTLGAGESLRMVGENNASPDSLGQYGLNFDLKVGEVLTLTYFAECVERVQIPDLSKDGVYVKDTDSGRFIEEKR
ncbi:MAG: CotH kinase family protein [Lachnospiraceae bacterium]|nr:CotH kinase family protein [Lachnospiraceae bacterium]